MGQGFIYRDLKVWRMGLDLCEYAYRLAHQLPREETFALSDQMRRAAVSVPANIAEGNARESAKSFAHHVGIACGSLAELDTLVTIAGELGYVASADADGARERIDDLRRALRGLHKSLRQQPKPVPVR